MLVPYTAALHPAAPWSAEVWLKPSTAEDFKCAVSNGEFGSNRSGWLIYQIGDTWNLRTYSGVGTGTAVGLTSGAGSASMNTWHHLVVVNDGVNILFYVDNGTPLTAPIGATVAGGASGGTCLGARSDGGFFFPGAVDEFAIYPTALSAADVAAHYANGNDAGRATPYETLVGTSNPVGYYRLEETSEPVLEATIFAVATLNNENNYSVFGNRTNNDERWLGGSWSEVNPGAFRGARADFNSSYAANQANLKNGTQIFSYESSPSAYRFLLNGTELGSTTGDYNTGSGANWTVGTNAISGGNGAELNGDVAELIIYNRILSSTESSQVGAYLSAKYGLTTDYIVAGFISFGIAGSDGVIDNDAKTISLAVPFGTDLATLAPDFVLTTGGSDQTSGSPPSPTFAAQNPATYTVTDGATVNNFTVTVTVLPATATYVIDLGAGTVIEGNTSGTYGLGSLPLPPLPVGSILRKIETNVVLEATDADNYANDLAFLVDPTPGTPGGDYSMGICSSDHFGATLELGWANGGSGPPTGITDTQTDADWSSLGDIDLNTSGVFLGNGYGGPTTGGTWSGTITLTYDVVGGASPYSTWAGGAVFDADDNGDGVANGLAWILGATDPNVNSTGLLPAAGESAGGLTMHFLRVADLGSATLSVEYSSDLGQTDPWHAAVIPATSGTFGGDLNATIILGDPDDVTLTIPAAHAAGGQLYGRLKAAE